MAKLTTTYCSDAMRRDLESINGMAVPFMPSGKSQKALKALRWSNSWFERRDAELRAWMPANDRPSGTLSDVDRSPDAIEGRLNKCATRRACREIFGTANVHILASDLRLYHRQRADRPIDAADAMRRPPYVALVDAARHDCRVEWDRRKDASDSDTSRSKLVYESLTNWSLIHIATSEGKVRQSDGGSWVDSTIHAEAHVHPSGLAWAIIFRAEYLHVDDARRVEIQKVRWVNPSELPGEIVDNLTAQCVTNAGIDPKRLRFFVDASIPYRCESEAVRVNGKTHRVKVQKATSDVMVATNKFLPQGQSGNEGNGSSPSLVDAFKLAEARDAATRKANSSRSNVRCYTRDQINARFLSKYESRINAPKDTER